MFLPAWMGAVAALSASTGSMLSSSSGAVTPNRTVLSSRSSEMQVRRFGIHLGLNATLTVDVSPTRWFQAGCTTQLTGLGYLFDSQRNWVASVLLFAGAALPLIEGSAVRLTADIAPMVSYFHSAPVNMFNAGLLVGVRLVHASGFTLGTKLPLVGYAVAPDAGRSGLLYYYTGAIPTVPLLTVGYSF